MGSARTVARDRSAAVPAGGRAGLALVADAPAPGPAPVAGRDAASSALPAVRRLAPGLAIRAAVHDQDGTFPHGSLADLRAAGLAALTVPAAMGGGGAGLAGTAAAIGLLAQADPSSALILAMQGVRHAGIARSTSWPPGLARTVQRSAVESGALLNILRVEPELGSPARGGLPATVARRTRTGWRLTGRKIHSTGAPGLAWGLVWAKSDEHGDEHEDGDELGHEDEDEARIGLFLVPGRCDRGVALTRSPPKSRILP